MVTKQKKGSGWPYSDKDGSVPSAPPAMPGEVEARLKYKKDKEAALEQAKAEVAAAKKGSSRRMRRKTLKLRGGSDDLVAAVMEDNADAVEQHLTPDVTPELKNYLLMYAAKEGQTAVVEKLLNHGANPNIPDKVGYTPIWWAAFRQNDDVVRLLIDHGADVDVAGMNGKTARDMIESPEVATLLLAASKGKTIPSAPIGARRKHRTRKVKRSY